MVEHKLISSLNEGDNLDSIYIVKFRKGFEAYARGYRFILTLGDKSNRSIELVYWGPDNKELVEKLYNSITPDSTLHVKGVVRRYSGKLQISTNFIELIEDGNFDFIPQSNINPEVGVKLIRKFIGTISNDQLRGLLNYIFNDDFLEQFKFAPAAIEIHHARRSGLLEHTIEVVKIVDLFCSLYPSINRDLAISGALLHDIGKIDEIKMGKRIKSEFEAQLIGHITFGAKRLNDAFSKVPIDTTLQVQLLHIILSHHGYLEYGSPKEPMTLEAFAVYHADHASADLMQLIDFISKNKNSSDGDNLYHRRLGRNIKIS